MLETLPSAQNVCMADTYWISLNVIFSSSCNSSCQLSINHRLQTMLITREVISISSIYPISLNISTPKKTKLQRKLKTKRHISLLILQRSVSTLPASPPLCAKPTPCLLAARLCSAVFEFLEAHEQKPEYSTQNSPCLGLVSWNFNDTVDDPGRKVCSQVFL